MKKSSSSKNILSIFGIVFMAFLGGINCAALYQVAKKICDEKLKKLSIILTIALLASFFAVVMVDNESSVFSLVTTVLSVVAFAPTILVFANIGKYKAVLDEESEKQYQKIEEKQQISQEKKIEELLIQERIEKEKRMAEEKRLEGIRIQEEIERAQKKDVDETIRIESDRKLEYEKKISEKKLVEVQKQHTEDIAALKADADKKLNDEKKAAEEREEKLRQEIEELKKSVSVINKSEDSNVDSALNKLPSTSDFCRQCGKPLIQGKKFCIYCGAKN